MSAWLQPPLVAIVVFAALYVFGARRRRILVGRPQSYELWRAASFTGALALAELVLCPPFDRLADESLGLHMLQHVVLMAFVAPLAVLAAPWLTIWRGLPLELRRSLARGVLRFPGIVRRGLRGSASPWPAWLLINVDIGIWHVPWLYDLTLSNAAVHDVEHLSFLVFGILFWLPVLDSPPLHARLDELRGALYVTAGAAPGWILALVLALAAQPLYPAYAALPHRWAGLSALGDQQLAAGVMIGIGSIPYTLAVFVLLYRWLDERPRLRRETLGLVRSR
ncbi:MAG TPA: cytochrome c oxidase assembly protein [Gaiellaceae bacterium]|nr:cytochrome c oxidase assembly protein [Gaiellaceae bacterium]